MDNDARHGHQPYATVRLAKLWTGGLLAAFFGGLCMVSLVVYGVIGVLSGVITAAPM